MPKFYDLSHGFDEDSYHPFGLPSFRNVQSFRSHGCRHAYVTMSLHTSTHIDAPWHMCQEGKRLDQMGVQELAGSAVFLDLSATFGPGKAASAGIPKAALESALKAAGLELAASDAVVVFTGWDEVYRTDPCRYYASYNTLAPDAAAWLVEKKARLVGIDSPDIDLPDCYAAAPFKPKNHRTLLGSGVYVIENVGGEVRALLGKRAYLIPAPMKVSGEFASGAPTRLLASEDIK